MDSNTRRDLKEFIKTLQDQPAEYFRNWDTVKGMDLDQQNRLLDAIKVFEFMFPESRTTVGGTLSRSDANRIFHALVKHHKSDKANAFDKTEPRAEAAKMVSVSAEQPTWHEAKLIAPEFLGPDHNDSDMVDDGSRVFEDITAEEAKAAAEQAKEEQAKEVQAKEVQDKEVHSEKIKAAEEAAKVKKATKPIKEDL